MTCQHAEHRVAIDHDSRGVNGDEAVGVAVERETDVRTASGHFSCESGRRRGAAVAVDVGAVRVVEQDVDAGPGRFEDPRRGHAAGTVGAIDHEMELRRNGRRQFQPVIDVQVE